jgi:hypothetical protein
MKVTCTPACRPSCSRSHPAIFDVRERKREQRKLRLETEINSSIKMMKFDALQFITYTQTVNIFVSAFRDKVKRCRGCSLIANLGSVEVKIYSCSLDNS